MRHRWSGVLRPAAFVAGALGLVLGTMGAGAGLSGATPQFQSPYKYATYVGGHGKANMKLSPVTIGVVNQRTSTNSPVPQWTTGVKVAVDYVNEQAGGVDGHPLKAIYCAVPTTVAAAESCGQQFADNSQIDTVDAGVLSIGTTALVDALAPTKKPILAGLALTTVLPKVHNAFVLDGTAWSVNIPIATLAKQTLHVKSASMIYGSNTPIGAHIATLVKDAFKFEGISKIYTVGYTTHTPNLTEPIEAAHVATTTLFIAESAGGHTCSDTYQALKTLGIVTKVKVIVSVTCDTPTVAKADGGQLPHDWYYLSANPLPGSPTKAVGAAETVFKKYGKAAGGKTAWQTDAFGQILTNVKFDNEILKSGNKITPAAVAAKARAFKGPMANGPATESCGSLAGFPAVCGSEASFFENTAPGVMKPIAYGVGMPKGFKV
ncbi:MAG: ABC transporter substrate-binding protein [Acidimicrobiales bacterium]